MTWGPAPVGVAPTTRSSWGPTDLDRQVLLARHRRPWLIAAALVAVPLVLLASVALGLYYRWGSLERSGVSWPAEVVSAHRYARASDYVTVAFVTPAGRLVEASIPVSNAGAHPVGSTEIVVYDAADPRRVRTLHDWEGPWTVPAELAFALGVLVVFFTWHAWWWPRRLWSVATKGPSGQAMSLRTVDVPGRVTATWALLTTPTAVEGDAPRLAFRVAHPDDIRPGVVEVIPRGRLARRAVVVLLGPDGPIWPSGRTTRPGRALVNAMNWPSAGWAAAPSPVGSSLPSGLSLPQRPPVLSYPPELFERKAPKRSVVLRTILIAGPAVAAALLPFVVPGVIESHRHVCATPPSPRAADTPVVAADDLAALLPSQVTGLTTVHEEQQQLGSFANPPTQLALMEGDFLYGVERTLQTGATTVKLEVFQFPTDLGASRYEAQRLASLCTMPHHRLAVPPGGDVSGTAVGQNQDLTRRIAFLRGSRDFIINITGPAWSGEPALLQTMQATAG